MPNLCNLCYSQDSTYKEPRTPTDHQDRVPHAGSLSRQHPGPQPESEAGNSYVLVAGDHLTKWMEAYAIPIKRPSRLPDEMFCRYSPPEQLHSDQGRQFESDFIKHICKILNVQKTRTSPYHPQCDGLMERFNRTLLHMLATTTREHPKLRLRR